MLTPSLADEFDNRSSPSSLYTLSALTQVTPTWAQRSFSSGLRSVSSQSLSPVSYSYHFWTKHFANLILVFLVPETKGLTLEQIDSMLEEVTPMKSRGWKPHGTFASTIGLTEKGIDIHATAQEVHKTVRASSVSKQNA